MPDQISEDALEFSTLKPLTPLDPEPSDPAHHREVANWCGPNDAGLGEASARASPAGPTFFTAAVARRPAARKGRSGGNGARSKPAAG